MIAKTNQSAAKQTYQPLSDNVLVRPLEPEQKTSSGIILPDSVKEKPQVGKVMAVGKGLVHPDGKITPVEVKVGQNVLYKKWGGNEVKVGSEEWMILKQEDILAIVE